MITQTELKRLFSYDKHTGLFTRIVSRGNRAPKGAVAGSLLSSGYIHIQINGRFYRAHRLAYLYMIGCFPDKDIDHKNGLPSDNRWENLRPCTDKQNQGNRKRLNKNNTSGYKGVYFIKRDNNWMAVCSEIYLGYFPSPEAAAEAYNKEATKQFGEFAFLNTIKEKRNDTDN